MAKVKSTLEIRIPRSFSEIWESIPDEARPESPADLGMAFVNELIQCMDYATQAECPQVVFNPVRRAGDQFIWEFYVNDLIIPPADRYNFHGQNVSQWLYAGAIVLQGKEVSRHH